MEGEVGDLRAALLQLRRATGLPIAFGGLLTDARRFRISEHTGTSTAALRNLAIAAGSGLGGKALALARPLSVVDYRASTLISHEYDTAVAAEGIAAILAVPVVVRRKVRGVLYGALRQPLPLGDRALTAALDAARDLEQALAVREEAQRLAAVCARPPSPDPAVLEEVRDAHAELRALAHRVADTALRDEMLTACGRLAAAWAGSAAGGDAAALTPRELDVLACVASGARNAAAAERLGLRPETVKSYLRSAMRKLGVHNRLEAVTAARRAGLLP